MQSHAPVVLLNAKASQENSSEFRANWRLLLAAVLGTALGLPTVPFYTIGIFAPTLAKTFGWSFASIFGGLSLTAVTLLVGAPFAGYLVDRHGTRRVAAVSLCGLGLSYISLAISNGSLLFYYACWVSMAVLGLGATFVSFADGVNKVFLKRRGLALGITMAGTGIFVLFVKPFAAWVLMEFGWRPSIVVIGCLPICVAAPMVLWGFPKHFVSHARKNETIRAGDAPGVTLSEAARTRAFWILVIILGPISFSSAAPFPHMENILRSLHFGDKNVLALSSLIGVLMVLGRLAGGWLIDRFWAPLVGLCFLAGAALGSWLLVHSSGNTVSALSAIVLLGLAAGVEGSLIPYLAVRYFGVKHYGVIYGLLYGIFAIGAATGPSLFGLAFDRSGSYVKIMVLCTALLSIAGLLLICMGPYPDQLAKAASRPDGDTANV